MNEELKNIIAQADANMRGVEAGILSPEDAGFEYTTEDGIECEVQVVSADDLTPEMLKELLEKSGGKVVSYDAETSETHVSKQLARMLDRLKQSPADRQFSAMVGAAAVRADLTAAMGLLDDIGEFGLADMLDEARGKLSADIPDTHEWHKARRCAEVAAALSRAGKDIEETEGTFETFGGIFEALTNSVLAKHDELIEWAERLGATETAEELRVMMKEAETDEEV